jgi:hypothetical protein
MKRALIAAALTCVLAADVRADPLPPDGVVWSYNWQPGAASVPGTAGGGVTFTTEPDRLSAGSSDVVATNLRTFSGQPAASAETFANGAYSLTLNLSLTQDGNTFTGSLTFTGHLTGTFSADSSQVGNVFDDAGPKVAFLGSYTFTVTLTSYTPPGPPSQTNAGSIGAHVSLDAIRTESVPEPSTLALTCLGGVGLLGGAWRRWRASRRLTSAN